MHLLWIMFVFLSLYIIRTVRGPSIWDRLLGLNLISSKIIIVIVVFASFHDTSYYNTAYFNTTYLLDFAIVCALLGFIGVIFITRFLLGRIKGGK